MPTFPVNKSFQLRKLNLSLFFFIVGMNVRYYSQCYGMVPYSEAETNLVRNLSFIFFPLAMCFGLLEGRLQDLRQKYRLWFVALMFGIFSFFLYGVYAGNDPSFIRYDLAACSYFSALLVASRKSSWKILEKMLFAHYLIGVLLNIYAFYKFPPVVERVRVIGYYIPYMLQSVLYPWPYFLLTFYRGGIFRKLLSITGAAVVLLSFIFFQKRLFTLEFLFLSAFALYFYFRDKGITLSKSFKAAVKMGIVISLFVVSINIALGIVDRNRVFSESFAALQNRLFTQDNRKLTVGETFSYQHYNRNERVEEARYFFAQALPYQVFFGLGIGGNFYYPPAETYRTLHLGVANFVLKGGIGLLLLWMFGFLMVIKDFFLRRKASAVFLFAYAIVLNYTIKLFISSSWDPDLWFGFMLLCAGVCMSKELA